MELRARTAQVYPQFSITEPLSPDGSQRRIFRGVWAGRRALLFLPSPGPLGLAEAAAFWAIGSHLSRLSLPVPRPLWHHPAHGAVVVEEKQGALLQELVGEEGPHRCRPLLLRTLERAAAMAWEGARGFRAEWCWETPVYDSQVALQAEARYFLHWVGRRLVGLPRPLLEAAHGEAARLARRVDRLPTGLFLHRDLQSRNIIVDQGGEPWFIDYQGGRLGPFGYDLVSLIFDAYLGLPGAVKRELLEGAVELGRELGCFGSSDEGLEQLRLLALFRSLQAGGAFAKLGWFRGKGWFKPHLPGVLATLAGLLRDHPSLPALREAVERVREVVG